MVTIEPKVTDISTSTQVSCQNNQEETNLMIHSISFLKDIFRKDKVSEGFWVISKFLLSGQFSAKTCSLKQDKNSCNMPPTWESWWVLLSPTSSKFVFILLFYLNRLHNFLSAMECWLRSKPISSNIWGLHFTNDPLCFTVILCCIPHIKETMHNISFRMQNMMQINSSMSEHNKQWCGKSVRTK